MNLFSTPPLSLKSSIVGRERRIRFRQGNGRPGVAGRIGLFGLLAFGVLALLGAACADYDTSLVLVRNQVPDTEACTIPATEDDMYRTSGTLDLSGLDLPPDKRYSYGYLFTPLVKNFSEVSIQLQGANTELLGTDDASDYVLSDMVGLGVSAKTSERISGTVTGEEGRLAVHYLVVDYEQAKTLAESLPRGETIQIIARTQVYGEAGGHTLRTNYFEYPIRLCKGCVVPLDGTGAPVPDPEVCGPFQFQL
ncbi:MAG: hypothetical protein V2A73_15850 [Pseudomonadota bacterium]